VRTRLLLVLTLTALGGATALPGPAAGSVGGGNCPGEWSTSVFVRLPLAGDGSVVGSAGTTCTGYDQTGLNSTTFAAQQGTIATLHGSIVWSGDGTDYSYTPTSGFSGRDGGYYCQVSHTAPQGGCQNGNAPNAVGFILGDAVDDSYTIAENHTLAVGCTGCAARPSANDLPTGSVLFNLDANVTDTLKTAHGTVTGWGASPSTSFAYTPDPGFVGTDSFKYCETFGPEETGCDPVDYENLGGWTGVPEAQSSNIATVTITVTNTDTTPTATLKTPSAPFDLANDASVSWSGADFSGGTGLSYFELRTERAKYDGPFGSWSVGGQLAPSTTNAHPSLQAGYDYCFEVRATDKIGHQSAWTSPRCTARPIDDKSLTASGHWTRKTGSADYLGTISTTTHHDASLSLTSVHADRIALVATRCRGCGEVGVYTGGSKLIGKINLSNAKTVHQALLLLPKFPLKTTTITVKVLSTGKTVQIDGLGVSRT
jgi:hypothetical protein